MTRFWPETRPYICPFPHFTVMPRQPLTPTHTSPVIPARPPARFSSPVLPARPPCPPQFPRPSRPATLRPSSPVLPARPPCTLQFPRPSRPATLHAPVPPSFPPGHPARFSSPVLPARPPCAPVPPSFPPGHPARSSSPAILTLPCHSGHNGQKELGILEESDFMTVGYNYLY